MADYAPVPDDAVDEPLFAGYEPAPEPEPQLSAGQRLTVRQAQNIAAGIHPLTRGRLHPLASRHRDASSPKADPFTCGSCWFREVKGGTAGRYVKCWAEDGKRVTGGPATDVRAWWPACPEYTPSDRVSPDAARSIPVEGDA